PDATTRFTFYIRIASAHTETPLEAIKVGPIDPFGLLPDPARTLLDVACLGLQAHKRGSRKREGKEKGGANEEGEKKKGKREGAEGRG
ncbi:hypothetical protein M8360_32600, partial [Klebsiella pneumoniae]|nr:hypothetical protein [Klebsiella pneumoniae]